MTTKCAHVWDPGAPGERQCPQKVAAEGEEFCFQHSGRATKGGNVAKNPVGRRTLKRQKITLEFYAAAHEDPQALLERLQATFGWREGLKIEVRDVTQGT